MSSSSFYFILYSIEAIESLALSPIKKLLSEIGGWPVISDGEWNESSWRWKDVVMKIENLGFSSNFLFDISAGPDSKNTSQRILTVISRSLFQGSVKYKFRFLPQFDQPALGLSKEYFSKGLDHELVRAYKKYQVDFAVIFGASSKDAQKEMFDVLLFEKSLADVSKVQNMCIFILQQDDDDFW